MSPSPSAATHYGGAGIRVSPSPSAATRYRHTVRTLYEHTVHSTHPVRTGALAQSSSATARRSLHQPYPAPLAHGTRTLAPRSHLAPTTPRARQACGASAFRRGGTRRRIVRAVGWARGDARQRHCARRAALRVPRLLEGATPCSHGRPSPGMYGVHVPASCGLCAPEAQGSLPRGATHCTYRRTRTSLGRAVRTTHRGTLGGASPGHSRGATRRRQRRRPLLAGCRLAVRVALADGRRSRVWPVRP